jgi:hypothetical protein
VAGSHSLARRCGTGVETTGGKSAVQTSDRILSILACVSSPGSGSGAAAGGGGVGGDGDRGGDGGARETGDP